MTGFDSGDIVLVEVEFTDRSGAKLRPAVVLSPRRYNQLGRDVVIAPITSNLAAAPHMGDHRIMAWQRAGLLAPGTVQAKPTTLDERFIVRKVGALLPADLAGIQRGLSAALGLPGPSAQSGSR